MIQLALLSFLYVLGLAVCMAWGPRRDAIVCCALAFPVGVAAAGALALATLYFSAPFVGGTAGGGLAIFAATIWRARCRWQPGKRDLLALGVGSAVFLGFAILFCARDATLLLSNPAHRLVLTAQTLGADVTSFDPKLWKAFAESGPLLAAAYGLAELVKCDYFYALQPLLLVSLVAVVATVGERGGALLGTPSWARIAAVLFGALLLARQFAVLHVFVYVDSSALAVIYVTCFLAIWWLAEVRGDASMTPVALLCLAALFLLSELTALFGLLLFAIAIFPSKLAPKDLDLPVGVTVASLIAWLAAGAQDFPKESGFFAAAEAQHLLVGLIALYLVWIIARRPALFRFVPLLPVGLLILAVVATAVGILTGAGGLDDSAAAVWRTFRHWSWNATWPTIMVLVGFGLLAGHMPRERLLACILPLYGVAFVWLGRDAQPTFFRPPFGDLHALATQAVPATLLYLLLKFSWLLRYRSEGPDEIANCEAPSGTDSRRAIGIGSVVLLTALLLANLHHAGFTQKRMGWRYRLGPIEVRSLTEETRRLKHRRVRYTHSNYYLVAERIRGGRLLLPREFRLHAPYFRDLAGLDVEITETPLSLSPSAVERLLPYVDETWKFRVRRGDIRDIHFIFEEGITDWVLVTHSSGAPIFWLPRELYGKSGGRLLIQVALFVAIYLLGVAFAVALGPSRRTHFCCALAYPIGLVLWVGFLFAALALGLPHNELMLLSLYIVLLLGLIGVGVLRHRLGRHLGWPIAKWTASFTIIAGILASFNIARFGADSFSILLTARVIDVGELSPLAWRYMAHRSLFHPVAHSVAGFLGLEYLYSHHAMLAASFIIAFGFLLIQGLRRLGANLRTQILITVLIVSAMVSSRVITYHLFYIHMNFSAALYLTLFVVLFWLAEIDRDYEFLPLSGVAMVGFALQRLETGAVAALFLALLLAETRLPTRPIVRSFVPAVVVISAWFLLVAENAKSPFVSPAKSAVTIVALGGVFAYWRSGLWRGLRRRIPQIALATMVAGLACAFAIAPAHMAKSANSLFENIFPLERRWWGLAPWTLVALAPLAAFASRVPFDRVFAYGIPTYLAFILVIVIFRGPYRVMWADSGFRMVIHIVPLTFFFLALRLGPLIGKTKEKAVLEA